MSKKIGIFSIAVFLFFNSGIVLGQTEDFNLWTSITIEKELVKNLEFGIELENRMRDNLNSRDETLADFGISYSYKSFSAGFIYRVTNVDKVKGGNVIGNRLTWQLGYDQDIKRFKLDLRARYQKHYEALYSSEDGYLSENFIRSRIKLRYNIKGIPLEPFVSYESFLRLNVVTPKLIEKERYSLGANYKINKDNTVGVTFHVQPEKNVPEPKLNYILALNYKLEL